MAVSGPTSRFQIGDGYNSIFSKVDATTAKVVNMHQYITNKTATEEPKDRPPTATPAGASNTNPKAGPQTPTPAGASYADPKDRPPTATPAGASNTNPKAGPQTPTPAGASYADPKDRPPTATPAGASQVEHKTLSPDRGVNVHSVHLHHCSDEDIAIVIKASHYLAQRKLNCATEYNKHSGLMCNHTLKRVAVPVMC